MMTPEDHINLAELFLEQAAKDLSSQLFDRARIKAAIASSHAQVAAAISLDFKPRFMSSMGLADG